MDANNQVESRGPKDEGRMDRATVIIGKVSITRLQSGQLWLNHAEGEGMQVSDEAELAALLDDYFHRRF